MIFPRSNQWIPVRLAWQQSGALVDWCYLAQYRFTEPFFADTVALCMNLPFNVLFSRQTPIDDLLNWQRRQPGLEPTGFIFHMSRCGSTLVSQMLAASPRNVMLSEPVPVDQVLRMPSASVTDEEKVVWLRAMVSALGQRRRTDEERLFIKFDSWHTLDLPIVRAAFPATPWIFLYRDPIEVLTSQITQRGEFLVDTPLARALFDIEPNAAAQMKPEEFCTRVLARILQGPLTWGMEGGLLVNYDELPEAVETVIARHFGVTWSSVELEKMRSTTQFDAKNPRMYFAPDSDAKQRQATEAIREMSGRWLAPLYNQLEDRRRSQTRVADIQATRLHDV